MKHLLTWIGDNDCRLPEKGAVIRLQEAENFDHLTLLISHVKYQAGAEALQTYFTNAFPETRVEMKQAFIENPTDHSTVYPATVAAALDVQASNPDHSFTVSVTSGTPTMHACWLLAVESGLVKGRLLQIMRSGDVHDVDLSLDIFPEIRKVDRVRVLNTWLNRQNRQLRKYLLADSVTEKKEQPQLINDRISGHSPMMRQLKQDLARIAATDIAVFLHGESGTGKELAAETLHFNSRRSNQPFIAVNCGAIPEHLFESEFFGHKKGAFTGAVADRKGRFAEADGGTLFLDEVADLPLQMQVKLLRVLQEGSIQAVGSDKTEFVNVRIISASNADLRQAVRDGRFRSDLFYRLLQYELTLPPLRERGVDILLIANQRIRAMNRKHGRTVTLSREAESFLLKQSWPGNVRQLHSALEVAWSLADSTIEADDIRIIEPGENSGAFPFPPEGIDLKKTVIPVYYKLALERSGGNAEQAAKLLGMTGPAFRAAVRKMDPQ